MRAILAVTLVFAGCLKNGGDGPQSEPNEPIDLPGKRCDACYATVISLGVITSLWAGLTIAALARPDKKVDRRVFQAGIGLGAATLAIGTTHAVLNRDELASKAIVPGIIGVTVGVPAIVSGVIGLKRDVTATPMSVPGGGGVAISGRF